MERIRRGDLELAYEVEGTGEPLVLVMGLGVDHHAWDLVRPLLRRYRLVLIDNRDSGESGEAAAPYGLGDMAADVVAVADHLRLERFHLVGASMGGAIAQHLALAAPARVATLTLVGTWARPDGFLGSVLESWRALVAAVPAELFVAQQLPWLFSHRFFAAPPAEVLAWQEATRARGLLKSVAAFQRQAEAAIAHDVASMLIMLRTPTLVLVGEGDILTPPRCSRHIVSSLFTAELVMVPATGHACFLESPKALVDRLLPFLDRHPLGG